jgi:Protein of unknown function DUF262/Protein of unknown function (DUF1524)
MSASNFKTENNTFRKLIGNGLTYRIPPFQRDYSWTDSEWEDLWADIVGTVQDGGEPAHYMGYLVLQSQNDKAFDVIDGQQRLTTLSLIALAVLKNLQQLIEANKNAAQNQRRMEQIRQTYIGYLDPVTLLTSSKLSLNRNNDSYYQTYLVPLGHLPQRGIKASEHGLRKAFEWFEKRMAQYVKEAMEKGAKDEGVALASLLETMSDRLFFTVINVTDDLNAYKVFETLNARGVRLSSTDLLKNYLFSVLDRSRHEFPGEMKTLEGRWESLVSKLGAEGFSDFLRVHWMSRKSLVRPTELFKTIRQQVHDRASVFELLRGMEQDMDTYLSLTNPDGSQWPETLKAQARTLRMFRVRQPFAMLLAAQRNLTFDGFASLLKACVVISLRYNVIGSQPTNEQERAYHRAAQKIHAGECTQASQVLQSLQGIYLKDEPFKAAFTDKAIRTTDSRNNRIVRYILCSLEQQNSGLALDFESDRNTIEHVLPQNPTAGWTNFSDEEADAMVYRLGNMALLEKSSNQALGNGAYDDKRQALSQSQFALTRQLAEENADWTAERIANRQRQLARMASAVWRVEQLS